MCKSDGNSGSFQCFIASYNLLSNCVGSCNMTLFTDLERFHIMAAGLIYRLDWCMPTEDVLSQTVNCKPLRLFLSKCNG